MVANDVMRVVSVLGPREPMASHEIPPLIPPLGVIAISLGMLIKGTRAGNLDDRLEIKGRFKSGKDLICIPTCMGVHPPDA